MNELPRTPSKLIRLALADLRKVEQDPRYKIDMRVWHSWDKKEQRCCVCLAGAVIAQTLEMPIIADEPPYGWVSMASLFPSQLPMLLALDCARMGEIGMMFRKLGLPRSDGEKYDRWIDPYSVSPDRFFDEMNRLADDLENDGY